MSERQIDQKSEGQNTDEEGVIIPGNWKTWFSFGFVSPVVALGLVIQTTDAITRCCPPAWATAIALSSETLVAIGMGCVSKFLLESVKDDNNAKDKKIK